VSSPREYRNHVTECLDSAKAAQSDAERQIFLDMAKAWLETAVQAVIPTASQAPAEAPPPDDPVPAVSDFAVACANDNAASAAEPSLDGPAVTDGGCEDVVELPAAEAAAATVVADPPGNGEADHSRASGRAVETNAGGGEQPALQWNSVLEAALCPWGPSTSSYWPR
jgi:hypothetical protein